VQATGSARVPNSYKTAEGYRLGNWVSSQRARKADGRISTAKQQRLEAVDGWVWDARDYDAVWNEGFAHLTAYVQATGSACVPGSYRTAEGYLLGSWVTDQRVRKDVLSADRRQRLEAVDGWVWKVLAAEWEEAFALLTAYVQATGSARVPNRYKTAEGYRLGAWVGNQRKYKDRMSTAKQQRLEAVDGWVWDVLAAQWEEAFAKLTVYAQANGSANVPQTHQTAEGHRLGAWVGNQRTNKDRLSAHRRRRLEALPGWVWVAVAGRHR
jgi:hypothetical protein